MITHRRLFSIVSALAIVGTAVAVPRTAAAADVVNVPGDHATIQAAIDAAPDGATVLVAPGTYHERIVISRAIVVESVAGPDETVIDGDRGGIVATVLAAANEHTTLRGFTVTGGETNTGAGGITTGDGPAFIEGNWILDNHGCNGAGVLASFSDATIKDNWIADNTLGPCLGGLGGGGVAIHGAGSATVIGNVIEDNEGLDGGGISLWAAGTPTITGNVIRRNTGATGGGIEMVNHADALITDNLISENIASVKGGGIAYLVPGNSNGPRLTSNTIAFNDAPTGSGVYAAGWDSNTHWINNIIASSSAAAAVHCDPWHPDPGPPFWANNVWNAAGPASDGDCTTLPGFANVSVDPLFVDSTGGDYHLRPDSPLIDIGHPDFVTSNDFDGDARPSDGDENGTSLPDIGFDEAVDPLLLDPARVEFDEVVEDVTSGSEVITLTNFGASSLSFSAVTVGGSHAGDFALSDETCTDGALAVSASCTVTVEFTPSTIGARTAALTILGPGLVGTRTIPLSGTGLDAIVLSTSSIAAPDTAIGATATAGTVTVTNRGDAAADITSVTIGGTNATDFGVLSDTCSPNLVAPAATCSVQVRFAPKAMGARAATLSIVGPGHVGTRTVSLTGQGVAPASGVAWTSAAAAGPAYTWNAGGAMAQTVQSGVTRLHAAYATDRVSGAWATDTGPYSGVYYLRSTNGTTWTTPKRLNSSSQHSTRLGLAAYGSRVYTTWVSQTKLAKYSPTAPRAIYFRANTSYGHSSYWKTAVRLTSSTGRVDYPSIAAAGSDVHIAWTDSATGSIKVASSRDRGVTWKTTTVGSTTLTSTDGRTGVPSIAASGSTVVVTWLSTGGAVRNRISANRGVSWATAATIGNGAQSYAHTAVRGTRIAVAWTTGSSVVVRQRLNGTWTAPTAVASLTGTGRVPYGATVALQDGNRIGLAWSEEQPSGSESDLKWVESATGGAFWFQPVTLGPYVSSSTRRLNDWPSVAWPTAGTRFVLWNGWTSGTNSYRQYIRKGTGAPVGPTVPAVALREPVGETAQGESANRFERGARGLQP